MVVENAERFGQPQIHQLRGRVGAARSNYCVLITSKLNDAAANASARWWITPTAFISPTADLGCAADSRHKAGLPVFRIGNLLRDGDHWSWPP